MSLSGKKRRILLGNTPRAGYSVSAEERQHRAEMEDGCRRILRYIQSMTRESFCQNDMAYDAVLHNLEAIDNAEQKLPETAQPRLQKVDRRVLADCKEAPATQAGRGRDPERLWAVANERIPVLYANLREKKARPKQPPRRRHSYRGQNATQPWHFPRSGWRDISWRVWDQFSKNNVSIVSAGIAFYGLLAVFPTLAALVSIYGLLLNPATVESQLAFLEDILPAKAWAILQNQLHALASQSGATLSVSAFIGILLALWSARVGTGALMAGLNIVYREEEKRSVLRLYATALLLTVGAVLFSVAALSLVVILPTLLGLIDKDLGAITQTALTWLRWPLLAAGVMFALTILYRFGPSRRPARWKWVSPGAVIATLLWLSASALFSLYVAYFGHFNKAYGSLGAVIILMLWFWLTALAILIGAQLNGEMEHQTESDTTIGGPKPRGERQAYMADDLGPSQFTRRSS